MTDTEAAAPVASQTDATPRPFSDDEYRHRVRVVQKRMEQRSLAALVVAEPANMFYLTGYDAWSFYMPQCVIVPADGPCHLFLRRQDAIGARNTAGLAPDCVHGYPESLVHRDDVYPYDWIVDTAKDLGLLTDSPDVQVAAEFNADYFTVRGYLSLTSHLPHAHVVDSHELVNWVRVVKSPAEQAMLRRAGQITQHVMQVALDAAAAGRRQCDVAADIQYAQAHGTAEIGGDYPAIVPLMPTGAAAGTPHLTWSDRPLREGEATTIELVGVHHRYHAPLARTVMLGRPPQALQRVADVIADGMDVTLAHIRPGSTGREACEAFNTFVAEHGLEKDSRLGYSIGVGYPPDWGEKTVSIRTEDTTVLQAGMAFHIILGMWGGGWGYELSESLLVTPDGASPLTDIPRILTVKE